MKDDLLISELLSVTNIEEYQERYQKDIRDSEFFGMPIEPIIAAERRLTASDARGIAYLSMEYGLATSLYNKFSSQAPLNPINKAPESEVFSNFRLADYFFTLDRGGLLDLPIYSGGLGVLAGDTVKTMADYKLPVVAIGILWHLGYFRQKFWFKYGQTPEKMHWDFDSYPGLIPLKNRVKISLKSEDIYLRLWKYYVYSYKRDHVVPLILLDSDLPQNSPAARSLTEQLYRSDNAWIKIMQRVILGYGGIAALKELGYNIDIYHLNEGHAALAFVERARGLGREDVDNLRNRFVYTCHTPVEAGHDRFSYDDMAGALKKEDVDIIERYGKERPGLMNLTLLSMNISSSINAVSHNHQKVMHIQFPKYVDQIKYVTNGVHHHTWMSDRFVRFVEGFPKELPDVNANPMILSGVKELKGKADFRSGIWEAHQGNKGDLCGMLEKWRLDKDIFTICWSRRMAAYKRPSLILYDINRLIKIAKETGPMQIILAGKAHPRDNLGFTYINEMLDKIDKLNGQYDVLKIIMLENYDIALAKALTSGVDVWLNNPLPPFEASGTSGMKAILNGVLQMSTVDGWIAEVTDRDMGAFFGYKNRDGEIGNEYQLRMDEDSEKLYTALEGLVGLYYKTNNKGKLDATSAWIDKMIECLAVGAQFNTYRMLDQYKKSVWHIE